MVGFVLSSLLLWGAFLGAFGVFDGPDTDEDPDPDTDGSTITGTSGADDLLADGNDTVEGFGGDDTIEVSGNADGFGNLGNDTLAASGNATAHGDDGADELTGTGDAVLFGGAGMDSLTADGTVEARGGEDADTLTGSDESQLFGAKGDDLLFGSGSAAAYGEAGDDNMTGAGNSSIYGGDGTDSIIGSGNAALYGGAGNDVMGDFILTDTPQTLDALLMDGGEGDDLIRHLSLDAEEGASTLLGGAGEDRLYSITNCDVLDGGADNDILSGANGVSLTGGAGKDIFEIRTDQSLEGAQPTVITDFLVGQDQLALYLPPGDWLEGMEVSTELVNGSTLITVTFDQNAGNYPGEPGSAPQDFQILLQGVDDPHSVSLSFADITQAEPGEVQGGYGIMQGDATGETLSVTGNFEVLGGGGDDVITMGAEGNASGGDGNDVIIRNVTNAEGASAHISGTYGGAGDDIIILGSEGINSGSVDGGQSYATFGGEGDDVFMIDPAGFEDGTYVEIRDYSPGDEIVILADPSEVTSAEWSAVVVDGYNGIYRYYLNIQMADGTSLNLKLPADADFDPDNPPGFPVTFDANAASGLTV